MRKTIFASSVLLLAGVLWIASRPAGSSAAQISSVFVQTKPFSATPVFDGTHSFVFKITLAGNVTSSTFVNAQPGQTYTFIVCQDSAGLRSFTWPTSFRGVVSIPATSLANTCAAQAVVWDGARAYGLALGQRNL